MIKVVEGLTSSPEVAREILEKETNRVGIFIDVDRVYDYLIYYGIKSKYLTNEITALTGKVVPISSPAQLSEYVIHCVGIPSSYLLDFKGKKISTETSVLERIRDDKGNGITDKQRELVSLIIDAKRAMWVKSHLAQYVDFGGRSQLLSIRDYKGARMALVKPVWKILATGRISASNPSIQNIPRDMADIITYPPGFLLVYSDSGQIEPRINYSAYVKDALLKQCILVNNDAYYGQLQFMYMTPEEEQYYRSSLNELKPIEVTDDWKAKRQEFKRVLLMGSYGSSMQGVNRELQELFKKRIQEHPAVIARENKLRDAVYHRGVETFHTAFGRPITPDETDKYTKGSNGWLGHLFRCGLNNPMQGTAADLMNESVLEANTIIQRDMMGQGAIGYYKHDEGMFYIPKTYEHMIPEIAGCLSYDVTVKGEKWIPIYSDLHIGQKPGDENVPYYGV